MYRHLFVIASLSLSALLTDVAVARDPEEPIVLVEIDAKTKKQRDRISMMGFAIDGVSSETVLVYTTRTELKKLEGKFSFEVTEIPENVWAFPGEDAAFHDYAEMKAALDAIVKKTPDIARLEVIGKTVEGREIYALRLSAAEEKDVLPTSIFLGCHHAREHLSAEVPLKLAQYLSDNYDSNPRVQGMLQTREVWIVPMVNPDGAEYDIQSGRYRSWRKNRRKNANGSYGVDLNRNYAKGFGGAGASSNPSSDTYHGPSAFSEPETQAVRDFVRARKRATVLLTYHTFSELILWPPGYTNAPLANQLDRQVFETMGRKMASWNGYQPMQSSQLYVASGDTTDWAYDELKIFAFTFELTPKSQFAGGFYPGARAIESTFKANLEPALYLIEQSIDPYSTVTVSSFSTSEFMKGNCKNLISGSELFGNK